VPLLVDETSSCGGGLDSSLAWVIPWLRDRFLLGLALEEQGRGAEACAQYSAILARWGHARPRSVSADEARAHATKLGCGL
jgi:serine/threonine-protein kinase